ncbi:uncharacterized protein CLUP02_03209 [Colletotrichum lupini]|uniref:Uncharacterized protein n=1 Tax=Colletotrichum lupini TaxID=145971 RepID=A0A9Q8WBK9_9PEZI|nr:uncharacterized protein CLUP02_03209 [Colletotrichum lupini]UQC77738.1 hypothetical protein CLUP02_03209 [Colletotrichum lupini]
MGLAASAFDCTRLLLLLLEFLPSPGLGPRRVVSGELPMRSCHACRGGAVVAVQAYLTFLTCIASFQVASPFPSRPIAGSIWKGPQLRNGRINGKGKHQTLDRSLPALDLPSFTPPRRLLLLTCAVSVCLEFLSFADRSRIELEYLPIQSIASSAFILCRATLTRPVTSVVWHGWVKGWLTPLANQLTDCHFASTNSQASTLSRRQVYLSLDSMSPLTAMSTSSLLCIYAQHAWNVSCFLDPTMLELPDASVRDAESLTVNTKENQTRFSGLRTQNAKQEPISLDSRRCTATTTGNGHVWYRSSPRPRCAPTPRRKNNRLSATTTYNISFRLADAAFPIRRRRRSMTGYNLLRRDVAKMKDHRAIINLVTHGFQNPWNRLHRCRHCLRCCRAALADEGTVTAAAACIYACIDRTSESTSRSRSGTHHLKDRPDYPCNSAAWIVLGVMVSGIGRAANSLWNLPTKSIRPWIGGFREHISPPTRTNSNPPISRNRHRMAQKLRRNVKDSKTQDPFSSLFVPPVALHDLDAVDKSVVALKASDSMAAKIVFPNPSKLLSSSCLHECRLDHCKEEVSDGSATPASSHVAASDVCRTRNEMSDETSCAIAPTTFQLFTLTWRVSHIACNYKKALDWEPMEHYQLPHADGRSLAACEDLAFLSLAVSSHDLRLTQMLFTRYTMIERWPLLRLNKASRFRGIIHLRSHRGSILYSKRIACIEIPRSIYVSQLGSELLAALQADAFAPTIKTKPSPAGVAIKPAEISPPLSVNVGGPIWVRMQLVLSPGCYDHAQPRNGKAVRITAGIFCRCLDHTLTPPTRLPAFNVCLSVPQGSSTWSKFPSPTRPGFPSTLHIEDRCAALQAHDVGMEQVMIWCHKAETSFIRHNICTPARWSPTSDEVLAQPGADQEHAATVFTNTDSVGDSGQVDICLRYFQLRRSHCQTSYYMIGQSCGLDLCDLARGDPLGYHLLLLSKAEFRYIDVGLLGGQGLTTIFFPPLSWPAKVQSTSFVCFSGLEFPEPGPPVLLPAALPTTTDDEMAVSPPVRSASGSNIPTSIMGTRFEMDARAWDELEWGVDTRDLHQGGWADWGVGKDVTAFEVTRIGRKVISSDNTQTPRLLGRYVQTVPAYHVVRVTKHQLFVRKKKALGRETKGGDAQPAAQSETIEKAVERRTEEAILTASHPFPPSQDTGRNRPGFISILLSFDLIQQVTKLLVGASPLVPTSITQIFLGDPEALFQVPPDSRVLPMAIVEIVLQRWLVTIYNAPMDAEEQLPAKNRGCNDEGSKTRPPAELNRMGNMLDNIPGPPPDARYHEVNNVDARLPGHVHTGTRSMEGSPPSHSRAKSSKNTTTCLPKRAVIDEDPKTHIHGSGTSVVSHSHTPARLPAPEEFTCKTAIKVRPSKTLDNRVAETQETLQHAVLIGSASFFFFLLKVEERLIGIPIVPMKQSIGQEMEKRHPVEMGCRLQSLVLRSLYIHTGGPLGSWLRGSPHISLLPSSLPKNPACIRLAAPRWGKVDFQSMSRRLYSRDPAEWEYTTWMPLEIHAHFHHALGVEVVMQAPTTAGQRTREIAVQPEAGSGIPLLLESVSRVKVLTDSVDFHMGSLRRSERTQLYDSPCSNVVQPPETIPGRQEERKTTSRRDASPRPPVPGKRFGSRRRSNVTVVVNGASSHRPIRKERLLVFSAGQGLD